LSRQSHERLELMCKVSLGELGVGSYEAAHSTRDCISAQNRAAR
jgi:hypothetical protein